MVIVDQPRRSRSLFPSSVPALIESRSALASNEFLSSSRTKPTSENSKTANQSSPAGDTKPSSLPLVGLWFASMMVRVSPAPQRHNLPAHAPQQHHQDFPAKVPFAI